MERTVLTFVEDLGEEPVVAIMGGDRKWRLMTHTVHFTVIGEQKMHCEGCEQRISKALRRLPGIQEVQASAHTQQVVVTIEPGRVTPDQVRTKLEQLGYDVTPLGGPR